MAVTGTSVLGDSIQTAFDAQFETNFSESVVWFPIVDWRGAMGGSNLKGTTMQFTTYEPLMLDPTALTETSDVTPQNPSDSYIQVSLYEYGNAIQTTHLVEIASFNDIPAAMTKTVAQNMALTLDILVRTQVIAGTDVLRVGNLAARTDLDATSDLPTSDWIAQLVGRAQTRGIPAFDDGTYVAYVHPMCWAQIKKITEVLAVGEYSDPQLIYTGSSSIAGKRLPGEVGMLHGLRFVAHPLGKIYLSGGTTPQGATAITSAHAVSAGDTTIYVDETTGLVAGNYITVGTLEAWTAGSPGDHAEQVLITAASASSGAGYLTIQGAGNTMGNFGFKYGHAVGAAVTEAANVAAVPVMGPKSIAGYFATDPGKMGRKGVAEAYSVIPGRFQNYFWYWLGGVSKVDKWIVRGECAISYGVLGDNRQI